MLNIEWSNIPTKPGVYLWKGVDDQVIYVGKAKNLRNRMKQYFNNNLSYKNKVLLQNIVDFDIQVCASEMDALKLEENLINEYEPKYNIKIKSAKKYPYIEMKVGSNIKLSISKDLKFKKKSKYYGPYPDGFSARKIINLLSSALPLDECLSPKAGKVCLNYEMNRCMGQCISQDNEEKKTFIINTIEDFFKGKTKYIEEKLRERIENNNKLLDFEASQKLVEHLEFIQKLNEQKSITFKDTKHRDIFNYYVDDEFISISIMYIRFGRVNISSNFMNKFFNPDPKDLVESFIHRYYQNNLRPDEVIVPFEMDWSKEKEGELKFTVPKEGIKKDLLDLTAENAEAKYKNNIGGLINKIKGYDESIKFIKANFRDKEIHIIEMVDISSTMGSEQVGAVVQFKNGEPNKTKYRKYIIKDVVGMDDYASTEEVVRRHFNRKLEEGSNMPDVFIVDGKHQLSNARKVLKELKIENVILCALKKDVKHNTSTLINNELKEFNLEPDSHMFLFLARIQEEAHRFVINFHRSRRDKAILESELDKYTFFTEIDKQNLFKEFKSIRKIMIASETELRKVISSTKVEKFMKERE